MQEVSESAALVFYLSGFVSIRNSNAIRSIWNVVIRLIFVDVLQKIKGNKVSVMLIQMRYKENTLTRAEV